MRRSSFPRLGTYSSSISSYPNLSRRGSMRAISRPRKTDAIATHRLHKQKWALGAHSKTPRLPPVVRALAPTSGPTPARSRIDTAQKTKGPRGPLPFKPVDPPEPESPVTPALHQLILPGGPQGPRILSDRIGSVEAE